MIHLGNDVVLSSHTKLLTHDYAITRALIAIGIQNKFEMYELRPIFIGDNSFIGMDSIILPGAIIGKNVIVGAGSVVRGQIPDDSIIIGNPSKIIGNTIDWGKKKNFAMNKSDYYFDKNAPLDQESR